MSDDIESSDDICPFKIVKPADPLVPLLPSPNTANLEKIIFNIHNPVLLRLLVCKEEKHTQRSTDCLYPDHRNSNAVNLACDVQDKLAHVYIRNEQIDNTARSCVIVFIGATYLFDKNGLLNLFKNTVNWLNIVHEKPYFYIMPYYGKQQASVHTAFNSRVLNIELRKIYSDYSKDEDICIVIPVEKQAEFLRIDYTKNFYIKTQ